MAYDENRRGRRPSVLPKVLLGGFSVFMALGSFWGMIWFVRSIAEPPRVMALKPAVLASSESPPVPVKAAIPARAPIRAAAPVAPPAVPTDGLAERWLPIENVRPAVERPRPADEPKPVATLAITAPPPSPVETPPAAPAAIPVGTPIAGPIPLPRPRPSTNLVARAEPAIPLPRPRPDAAPEPVVAEPVVQADDRYPAQ